MDAYSKYKTGSLGTDYSDFGYGSAAPQSAPAPSANAGAAQGAAAAGGMSGNPYLMGGSFLLQYMAAKEAEHQRKQQQAMAMEQNYANSQNQAMQNLTNSWGRALL